MVIRAERHTLGGFVHMEAKFGGDDGLVAFPFQRTRQNPLAVAGAIVRGGIEKVDAEVERGMDGAN
jgi:hypothetical protein